jgi:hypothetical protein
LRHRVASATLSLTVEEATMIPAPHDPALDEQKREEARRQAESSGLEGAADAAEVGLDLFDLAAHAGRMVVDAAGSALSVSADAAKASIEVVGSVFSCLDGL